MPRTLQPPILSAEGASPSKAQSSLRRLHEQTQTGSSKQQQKDDVGIKTGEQAAAASTKGKPRLLLMGQRR